MTRPFLLNNEAIQKFSRPISNIVYMGMGEPLLNYNAVLSSINFITSKTGLRDVWQKELLFLQQGLLK